MKKLRDLLSRGYFPRELPPVFDTSSMRRVATMAKAAPASFWSARQTSEVCQHNVPRSGTLRRPLALPNPVSYANLCRELDDGWKNISKHLGKSQISKSTPTFYTADARAVLPEIPNQSNLVPFRALARSTGKPSLPRTYLAFMVPFIPIASRGRCTRRHMPNNTYVTIRCSETV